MSYPDKAEVMRAAEEWCVSCDSNNRIRIRAAKDALEAKLDQLYAEIAEAQKDARFKCRVPGCRNAALDQLPSEQPSVCAAHDPGR